MAEKNNENRNVTAKELLTRLSQHKSEQQNEQHSQYSAARFIDERLKEAKADPSDRSDETETAEEFAAAFSDGFENKPENEAPAFDTEDFRTAEESTQTAANTEAGTELEPESGFEASPEDFDYNVADAAAEDALLSDEPDVTEKDGAENADYYEYDNIEQTAGDEIYPDEPWENEIYSDEAVDEYGEYFPGGGAVDPEAYEAASYDGSADGYGIYESADDGYTEEAAEETDDGQYEDIMPDDDFFDNDPIEDEEESYPDEEPASEDGDDKREYSEEEDFENLVAEVNAASNTNSDGFDETDISLMVALGMEDQIAKKMGAETANQIDDFVADQEEWTDRTKRFGAGEYSDFSENAEIADTYRKKNRNSLIKLLISLALSVILLVYENLPVAGFQFTGALDPAVYPVVYLMVDLQLVLFAAALCIRRIGRGFADLLKLKPSVDTIPALLTLASVVVTAVSAYTAVPGVEPVPFNFPVVMCLMFTSLSEYLTVRREIFSFNIVSSNKPKFVMRRLSTRDSVMESEAVAGFESPAADEGDIIKIQKTDFVDGYFWRTRQRGNANRSYVGLALILSVALSVAIGIYAGISKNASAVGAGFATLGCAVPLSMVVIGCYPFYRASRRAYENDSTIIGEGSVEEYSGIGVISFDDVNVFPSYSVKVRNVRLYNNCRIDKVLYYAASVFTATGGPLADVFEVATMETGHSDKVEILETGSGYVEASVNGRSVVFGSAEALSRLGIIIPEDVTSDSSDIPMDCSVMYMIYQRKLVAKMIVNYVIDPDFEYVLKNLTGSGMCVCVKTFDPNIDEDMIYRQISTGKYSLRVIKYKNTEEITKYSKRAEGGIVSKNTTKSLLHTVSSCDKILSAQKIGFIIGVIASILSSAVMGVVMIAGAFNTMHSLYIALCQLFWLVPTIITTKMIVR